MSAWFRCLLSAPIWQMVGEATSDESTHPCRQIFVIANPYLKFSLSVTMREKDLVPTFLLRQSRDRYLTFIVFSSFRQSWVGTVQVDGENRHTQSHIRACMSEWWLKKREMSHIKVWLWDFPLYALQKWKTAMHSVNSQQVLLFPFWLKSCLQFLQSNWNSKNVSHSITKGNFHLLILKIEWHRIFWMNFFERCWPTLHHFTGKEDFSVRVPLWVSWHKNLVTTKRTDKFGIRSRFFSFVPVAIIIIIIMITNLSEEHKKILSCHFLSSSCSETKPASLIAQH